MSTTKFYLDTRRALKDGSYPMRICIQYHNKTIYYNTGISLSNDQWKGDKVIKHPQATILTNYLRNISARVSNVMLMLEMECKGNISVKEIQARLKAEISPVPQEEQRKPTFYDYAADFIEQKDNARTKGIYTTTISKLREYYKALEIEDITEDWLTLLVSRLKKRGNAVNTIAIDLRNIRAIYRYAMKRDKSYRALYPFDEFSIETEKTPYRTLSIEELVSLWYVGKEYPELRKAVNFFMLSFYIIGINFKDLCYLRKADIKKGIVTYRRAKTKKLYNIALQPEAIEIIGQYKSLNTDYLLNIAEDYAQYTNFTRWLNKELHEAGRLIGMTDNLTTYYARYTWANIAHRMRISKDVISMSLGHSFGSRTTDIYIDYDAEQVNEANRQVIDCLYIFITVRALEPYFRTLSVIFPQIRV